MKKGTMKSILFMTMLVATFSFLPASGFALFDRESLNGKLMDNESNALEGTYDFSFNIYTTATGGTSIYESNQTLTTNSDGVYFPVLDSLTLDFSQDYYVGVNINDTGEMTPRLNTTTVGTAINALTLNNLSSGTYLNDTDFGSGGLMKTDGSGVYSIVTDSSSNWDTAYSWSNHSTFGYLIGTEADLNVNNSNSSDNWDGLNSPDDFVNITVSGIIKGQPITGSIGSGIINCSENLAHCGCMNMTVNADLEIHYPEFTARIVSTDGTVVNCYKAEGDINVTDNSHLTYYLNSSCEWNSNLFETYHNLDLSPTGKVRIFDIYSLNGAVEEIKGNTLLALAKDKSEQINIFCSSSNHLSVCNGFEITQDIFPAINVSSGNSVYLNTYLPSDAKSSLIDGIHITHHEDGDWIHDDETGLNVTHCDNGTGLEECTGTVLRQYPIYSLNWNSHTKLHMLSPLTTGATFTSLSACLEATPDYVLPANEEYVAIVHHIYCARRTDTAWDSDAWIDLREEPVGAGGTPDLAPYLTVLGDKPLQSNWDVGNYNFTNTDSWFLGNILWDNLIGWDNFTGIPTATPSNGDTTHLSTADQIYDWVVSAFQPLEATLTDIADGTITENLINTDNPWADNEVSDTLTVTGYMQDEDINTFSELQSWVTDKTLVNEEDIFTIDANWVNTANPWDVSSETNLAVGNGVTLTDDTLTVVGGTAITADSGGVSITADTVGDTQLEYNTGQHLTTTSNVVFNNVSADAINLDDNKKIFLGNSQDSYIYDNGTALIIGRN